jgi:phosphoribosylglycinamide formyltransferase-1
VRAYRGRILNVHPALLPNFPGAHALPDAFRAKAKKTGVTVHFVNEGIDTGPVILQREVTIEAGDTLETLEKKIHAVEYELYPEAIHLVLEGKAKLR